MTGTTTSCPPSYTRFRPTQAALLVCDLLGFDIMVAPERIDDELETFDFHVETPLVAANDNLVAIDTVTTIRRGSRGIRLHTGALVECGLGSRIGRSPVVARC